MGDRVDRAWRAAGQSRPLFHWATIGITAACCFDHFALGHPWALESCALFVLIIQAFGLAELRSGVSRAAWEEQLDADAETRRNAELKAKGLR